MKLTAQMDDETREFYFDPLPEGATIEEIYLAFGPAAKPTRTCTLIFSLTPPESEEQRTPAESGRLSGTASPST